MNLTEPQRRGLLYYRRAGLPWEKKVVELKKGPRLKDPDPRVTWNLFEMGLVERGTGRQHWKLTSKGSKLAEQLRTAKT